jgi:pyruvate/2-oxoglutarate dehydrogenase complex dihydrolipoamide acyltransferase (E2) component
MGAALSALPRLRCAIGTGAKSAVSLLQKGLSDMATEILLPKIGFSMTEAQIAEWLAEDGAEVTEGQPLFLLEADKSANEVEAPASGTLRIHAEAGETYEVGTILGIIE